MKEQKVKSRWFFSDFYTRHKFRLDPLDKQGIVCYLLDSRWLLETVGVDSAQQLLTKVHVVEVFCDFVPVGLDDTVGVHPGGTVVPPAPLLILGSGTVRGPLVSGAGGRRSVM